MPNLGMHRTGVDYIAAFRRTHRGDIAVLMWRLNYASLNEVLTGICIKFGPATRATEIIGLTGVLRVVLRGCRIDAHSADGIIHTLTRRAFLNVRMGGFVPMVMLVAHLPLLFRV
jgi:hypothetical protein